MNARRSGLWLTLAILLVGCTMYDGDYFPYFMTGLDAWVYDNISGTNHYGGRVEATYFSRNDALSECASLANRTAASQHLRDWSYVCCTVTSSSDCVTKVR